MEAWTARAKSLLNHCQGSPACMAFLLDRLTDAVVAGIPELEGGETGDGAQQQQQQQQQRRQQQQRDQLGGDRERGEPLPHALASWLSNQVQVTAGIRLAQQASCCRRCTYPCMLHALLKNPQIYSPLRLPDPASC